MNAICIVIEHKKQGVIKSTQCLKQNVNVEWFVGRKNFNDTNSGDQWILRASIILQYIRNEVF